MLPKEKWLKILVTAAYIVIGAGALYLFLGKLLPLILPFLLAFVLGGMLRSPAKRLSQRLGLPRRVVGVILLAVVIFFLGFVIFLLANRFLSEAQRLFVGLGENSESIIAYVSRLLKLFEEKFPFVYEALDREVINGTVTEMLKGLLSALSAFIAELLASFVGGLPDIGLFFGVFVIASFYFAADFDRITEAIKNLPPKKYRERLCLGANHLRCACVGYLKAYGIITLVTFALLFVGFLFLRVSYATTLAVTVALLDMLPIIGAGTVLVPFGIGTLILGNYPLGIGIFVLFGVVTLVREFLEPRLIGKSMGIHPLLTLVAMYGGYKLFGIRGLILLPIILNLTKSFFNYTPKSDL